MKKAQNDKNVKIVILAVFGKKTQNRLYRAPAVKNHVFQVVRSVKSTKNCASAVKPALFKLRNFTVVHTTVVHTTRFSGRTPKIVKNVKKPQNAKKAQKALLSKKAPGLKKTVFKPTLSV